MQSKHSIRKRGGEWNVLLLGMVCALLAAAPASQASQNVSEAHYAMALAVLHQCQGPSLDQHQDEFTSLQSWQKHLPYLMTALHQLASSGQSQSGVKFTLKDTVNLPSNTLLYTQPASPLPRIAVFHNGIPTTHFLH